MKSRPTSQKPKPAKPAPKPIKPYNALPSKNGVRRMYNGSGTG